MTLKRPPRAVELPRSKIWRGSRIACGSWHLRHIDVLGPPACDFYIEDSHSWDGHTAQQDCHHVLAVQGCSLGASTDHERHAHDVLPMAASPSIERPKLWKISVLQPVSSWCWKETPRINVSTCAGRLIDLMGWTTTPSRLATTNATNSNMALVHCGLALLRQPVRLVKVSTILAQFIMDDIRSEAQLYACQCG